MTSYASGSKQSHPAMNPSMRGFSQSILLAGYLEVEGKAIVRGFMSYDGGGGRGEAGLRWMDLSSRINCLCFALYNAINMSIMHYVPNRF